MPVEHDPVTQIVNVHWEEGAYIWGASISVSTPNAFIVFPFQWNVTGNAENLFTIGTQPLFDSTGINYSGATPTEFASPDGVYGQGAYVQGVDGAHASISWTEFANFDSLEEAQAHIPLGGGPATGFELTVTGFLTDDIHPNAFVRFHGSGTSGLHDPEGNLIAGGSNSISSQLIFFNPYPTGDYAGGRSGASFSFSFDMSTGNITKAETKIIYTPTELLHLRPRLIAPI